VLGETLYAGRLARGERHEYDVLATDLEVRRPDGRLVALDRVRLRPDHGGVEGLGVLAGHDVVSMLYVLTPPDAHAALAALVHETVAGLDEPDLLVGVSALPRDAGVWMRLVGNDPLAVARTSRAVTDAVHEHLTGAPAPRIRKS